jgi:hypothetical protein
MDLALISSLGHAELLALVHTLGLLDECDAAELEVEDLQGFALSFVSSCEHFDDIYELCRIFAQPFDLIASLLESSDWRVTSDLAEQLLELSPQCQGVVLPIPTPCMRRSKAGTAFTPTGIPDTLFPGQILLFLDATEAEAGRGAVKETGAGTPPTKPPPLSRVRFGGGAGLRTGLRSTWPGMAFGVQRLTLERECATAATTTTGGGGGGGGGGGDDGGDDAATAAATTTTTSAAAATTTAAGDAATAEGGGATAAAATTDNTSATPAPAPASAPAPAPVPPPAPVPAPVPPPALCVDVCTVSVSSHLYAYGYALDACTDLLFWYVSCMHNLWYVHVMVHGIA